jgi:hypothetical protein
MHMSIYILASHNPQKFLAPRGCVVRHRGHRGGRGRANVGLRLGRHIPSCRRCRIRGSVQWGARGTSVFGERMLVWSLLD